MLDSILLAYQSRQGRQRVLRSDRVRFDHLGQPQVRVPGADAWAPVADAPSFDDSQGTLPDLVVRGDNQELELWLHGRALASSPTFSFHWGEAQLVVVRDGLDNDVALWDGAGWYTHPLATRHLQLEFRLAGVEATITYTPGPRERLSDLAERHALVG